MRISIVTLFPDMFRGPFDFSIIKRAVAKGAIGISYVNIREYSTDAYQSVDDKPYGGGHGMVLRVDVVDRALTAAKAAYPDLTPHTILMDPKGVRYSQSKARALTAYEHLIILCGHYEGVDERIRSLVDEEISIGDFILTCGEIPAMAIVDSVARLLPGVLPKVAAPKEESFGVAGEGILEHPHYTRPPEYKGMRVPDVLVSGDHAAIAKWKNDESKKNTEERRPDLL